jgi:hypothetical protein
MRHHLIGKQVYVLWVLQALDHPGNHSSACRINRHVELPEVFGNPPKVTPLHHLRRDKFGRRLGHVLYAMLGVSLSRTAIGIQHATRTLSSRITLDKQETCRRIIC